MPATHHITLKPPKPMAESKLPPKAQQTKYKPSEEIDEDVLKALEDSDEEQQSAQETPLTKTGRPDRRFRGQRDVPLEEVINPHYIRPKTGGTLKDGTHITMSGKPDRRFKENRSKPEEQVMSEWAEQMYKQYGKPTHH
jgi:hypothetical protein